MPQVKQCEAEQIFWSMPEMVEKMFTLLDLQSSFNLALVIHKETLIDSLTSKVWNTLIRDFCPKDDQDHSVENLLCENESPHASCQELKNVVKKLAAILKLLDVPKIFLLDLLDAICDHFPSSLPEFELQMSCPRHPQPHRISPAALVLLEEVETALGTAEFSLKSIQLEAINESVLLAMVSTMSRQQDAVTAVTINFGELQLIHENAAQAFYGFFSKLPSHLRVSIFKLTIERSIGEDGWKAVAKAVQLRPSSVYFIDCSRHGLIKARKEDRDVLWKAGLVGFHIYQTKTDDKDWWIARLMVHEPQKEGVLDRILEMSEEEFSSVVGGRWFEEDDSDSAEEEEEEEQESDDHESVEDNNQEEEADYHSNKVEDIVEKDNL